MGTSLTAGLGLDPSDAWPQQLEARARATGLRVRVVNAGLSGETAGGALRRVDWVLRGPADAFVLETGANDGLRGLNVDFTAQEIREVIAHVKKARPRADIFLVQMEAPPNLGPQYTAGFHAMYQRIAAEEHVTLIPFLLNGVAGDASLNQADGVHPTVRGERIVTGNMWKALRPELERLSASARPAS